jgi:hypothetical protein
MLRWRCTAKTEKYRPDFSSERAPHINKPETVKKKLKTEWEKLVATELSSPPSLFMYHAICLLYFVQIANKLELKKIGPGSQMGA